MNMQCLQLCASDESHWYMFLSTVTNMTPSPLQSDLFQTASFNHSKLLTHSYKEKMSKQLMSFTCNGQQAIIMESMKTKPRNSLIWLLN